jgi:hypothetical protein
MGEYLEFICRSSLINLSFQLEIDANVLVDDCAMAQGPLMGVFTVNPGPPELDQPNW